MELNEEAELLLEEIEGKVKSIIEDDNPPIENKYCRAVAIKNIVMHRRCS